MAMIQSARKVLLIVTLTATVVGTALPGLGLYADDRLTPQTIPEQQAVSALYETVLFAEGSAELSSEAETVLRDLARQLDRETPVGLVISAQNSEESDAQPSVIALAQARGEAVRSYLLQQGVNLAGWEIQHQDNSSARAATAAKSGDDQNQAVIVTVLTEEPVAISSMGTN